MSIKNLKDFNSVTEAEKVWKVGDVALVSSINKLGRKLKHGEWGNISSKDAWSKT